MSLKYPTGTETLKSEGYKYVMHDDNGYHVLYNLHTKEFERWTSHKYTACSTLKYKNTELEFCSSYNDYEKQRLLDTMRRIQNFGEQHPRFRSTMMNVYRKYLV